MKRFENAWLDLSGTGLFRYGMLVHGVNEAGFERFLFGTDYPDLQPRVCTSGGASGAHIR